jgi:histidine triad (HIT) family protein
MASIFTKIIRREIPGYIIAENDRFCAFLDIMPLVAGHVLVVPRQEVDSIFDLADTDLADLHVFAKRIAAAQKKVIPCKRIGVAVVGLEVPHAHVHLVPINTADDLNFTRPKLKPAPEALAATAEKIRKALAL